MSADLDRYRRVADGLTARVNAVPAEAWENVCPSCPEWTARQLMSHVIGNARWGLDQINEVEHVTRESIEDIPGEWAAVRDEVEQALADPVLAHRAIFGPFGPTAYTELIASLACSDMLIHTWDLARATGGDENLDPQLCLETLEWLLPMDEIIRRPGLFGRRVHPPQGADVVVALMSFCGRKV